MIKFKKQISDFNIYLKEMIWVLCKPLIIIEFIFLPFIIYFFLVGFLDDKEALIYGGCMLGIFAVLMLKILKTLILCKKNLKIYFNQTNSRGEIDFNIYLEDKEYVIENVTTQTSSRIKIDEIKVLTKSKNCIFLKTENNKLLFFPKTSSLVSLFFNN